MKTALIFTYYNNGSYGAVMQAWALQEILCRLGFESRVCRYLKQYPLRPGFWHYFKTRSLNSLYSKLGNLFSRWQVNRFVKTHIKEDPVSYRNQEELRQNPPAADFYICGSDQIWNTWLYDIGKPVDEGYFLNFGSEKTRRIAYAASFGTSKLDKRFRDEIRPWLNRIDSCGVREVESVDIVAEIAGKKAMHVCDPTLLLRAEEYMQLMAESCLVSHNKFGLFILGSDPKIYRPMVCEVERYLNDTAYVISGSVPDWLAQISNCKFLYTDSFHAVSFAIIFHTPFVVLQRPGGTTGRTIRIINLLRKAGLENRLITSAEDLRVAVSEEIDWSEVDRRIDSFRQESLIWLKGVLR